jgi:hypothetical protein
MRRSPIICASWDAVNNKSIGTCLEGSSRQRSCDYVRDRMTGGFGRAEFEALIFEDEGNSNNAPASSPHAGRRPSQPARTMKF